jgi:DNA-binding SARP family transcriptional activator
MARRGQFQVLGPLEVWVDRRPVAVGAHKLRVLLAALLVYANEVVSIDRLVDILWGQDPPDEAPSTLRKYVHCLRELIEPGVPAGVARVLVTRPPGYMICLSPNQIDAGRFRAMVAHAQRRADAGDLTGAATRFDEALKTWRGPAWAEFTNEAFARADTARLEALRALAIENRFDVLLAVGRHADVIGELEALIAQAPLREKPRAQLMLALHRCGRRAEALRVYEAFRCYLADEVGLEPSTALQRLQHAIALQSAELDWSPPEASTNSGMPLRHAFVGS